MKRFALLVLFALSLHTLLRAQTPKDSATVRAVRQLRMLEKQLHLNEDQVLQLQVILINRDIAMDSIQHNPSDGRARRSIQQDADQKINAILTDDQKTLYQQWKQQQKERMQQRRRQNQANSPQVNNP